MKKIGLLLLIFLNIFLPSCVKEEDEPSEKENTIKVDIYNHPTNILRKKIKFVTENQDDIYVEYWKEKDKSDLRKSQISKGLKEHEIEIILLESESSYNFKLVSSTHGKIEAEPNVFTTSKLDDDIDNFMPTSINLGSIEGYILYSSQKSDFHLIINNKGKVVWYNRFSPSINITYSFDTLTNTISHIHGRGTDRFCGGYVSCEDLYGNEIMSHSAVSLESPMMHHDVIRLRDGNWAYVNFLDRQYDFSALGIDELKWVRGDGFSIINQAGETVWAWNALDHINPLEDPNILSDDGAFGLMPTVDDFLHINSIVQDDEGDFYISLNRMEQLWKVDGRTGEVIFKLGANGDVDMPIEGFPHYLHSASLINGDEIMIFENGSEKRGEYSRVLSYRVDEENKTAEIIKNIILPDNLYSLRQSSVYKINDELLFVHSTMQANSAVINLKGDILCEFNLDAGIFRAAYIPEIDLQKNLLK